MNDEVSKNLNEEADEDFTKVLTEEIRIRTQPGLITGKGDGNWGRITVRTDGSILLENVALSNIAIRNCDLVAESGENPIPFADRMNQLEDFAAAYAQHPEAKLYAGHTHDYDDMEACVLCGKTI